MMLLAKQELEKQGKNVIAGYIAPDHDEYVSKKVPNGYNIHERITIIENSISEYDWLFVDPWMGIFCKTDINFTDVILRIEEYYKFHTNKEIEVYYVFGSDCERFVYTFENMGKGICIERPGYRFQTKNLPGIIYLYSSNRNSSTKIRSQGIKKQEKTSLVLRVENKHPLENDLIELFKKYYTKVDIVTVEEQKKIYSQLIGSKDRRIISLDSMIKGNENFRISRLYTTFGSKKLGYHYSNFNIKFKY